MIQISLFEKVGDWATSAKQLQIERIPMEQAIILNQEWHSQLPEIDGLGFGDMRLAFGAKFEGRIYGIAIWTRPVAANRMHEDTLHLAELRRLAIPDYAPKYTASRMLGRMARWFKQNTECCKLLSYQVTDVHSGTIYKAANWISENTQDNYVSWQNREGRKPGQNTSPKVRWEYQLKDCNCHKPNDYFNGNGHKDDMSDLPLFRVDSPR